MGDRHFRYCVIAFLLGVAGYGLVLSRGTGGEDFVNSYPFGRADGFDWRALGVNGVELDGAALEPGCRQALR